MAYYMQSGVKVAICQVQRYIDRARRGDLPAAARGRHRPPAGHARRAPLHPRHRLALLRESQPGRQERYRPLRG